MKPISALLIIILVIGCVVIVRGELRPDLIKEMDQYQQNHRTNEVTAVLEQHLNIGMDKAKVISYLNSEGFNVYTPNKPATSGDHYIAHYFHGWWLFGTVYQAFLEFKDDKLFKFSAKTKNEST